MRLKAKVALLVLVLISAAIFYLLYERIVNDDKIKKEAERATAIVMGVYLEDGMLGLIGLSKECFEDMDTLTASCVALDVAAGVLDRAVTNAMKLPNEDYFLENNVIQRAVELDNAKKFTNESAAAYCEALTAVVLTRLDVEWDKQKHKLD